MGNDHGPSGTHTTPTTTESAELAPQSDRPQPGERRFGPLLPPSESAGVRVTDSLALTISAYWACVTTIADDLATIPWRAMRKIPGGGREFAEEHPVDWLLHAQPNPEMTAFTFRQLLFFWVLTHGNGLAEIERDGAGRPVWLWPIEPWRVSPERDRRGRLYYDVQNYHEPNTPLDPEDVIHLKGLGDGVWGYSVLSFAARTLGLALASDRRASQSFTSDSRPGGWIKRVKKMSEEARKRYREDWKRIHAGNPNEIAIMEEGDEFHQLTQTSVKDAQLLESRRFSAEDISRWFKMPPPKIGILDRATWANIEQLSIQYVTGTLVPWGKRLEEESNLKLFGLKQRGIYYTRFFYTGLLRGDSQARANFYDTMIRNALMSPDEAREYEDLNPIPNGGTFFVPANWNTLERAAKGEPVSTPPPAGQTPDDDPPSQPEPSPDPGPGTADDLLASALRPVFLEAASRVVRREAHRLADARKRFTEEAEVRKWRAEFLAEHKVYVSRVFTPAAEALCGSLTPAVHLVLEIESAAACDAFVAASTSVAEVDGLADAWDGARSGPLADQVAARLLLVKKLYPEVPPCQP